MKYLIITILILNLFSSCGDQTKYDHLYLPHSIDSTTIKVAQGTLAIDAKKKTVVNPKDYDQVAAIVPSGWTIVENHESKEIICDDFNEDGYEDVAFLVEIRGDMTYDYSEEVMLIIAKADKNRQLEKVAISGNLGGKSVGYKDQKHLWSNNGVLSYLHQSMRYHVELKYRFDRKEYQYVLIGKEFNDYGGMSSPPRNISINYVTGKKIIREQVWDLEKEELVPLEEKIERFEAFQLPLSMLDWESIYGNLSSN